MCTRIFRRREFKLLLSGDPFRATDPRTLIDEFWQRRVMSPIERHGVVRSSKPKAPITLKFDKQRVVRFWDTKNGLLAANSLCLRLRASERSASEDESRRVGDDAELTLKLRLPDLLLASVSRLCSRGASGDCKFEEDIAPLLVRARGSNGKSHVCTPSTLSIRSRYSRSCTFTVDSGCSPSTLENALQRFNRLQDVLAAAGAGKLDSEARLHPGPTIRERVFTSKRVSFGEGIEGKFSLTLWTSAKDEAPVVAEVSYACGLRQGRALARQMPEHAARRALNLFRALQADLSAFKHPTETSKTALAIPVRVGAP
jgi:hypothetical protein